MAGMHRSSLAQRMRHHIVYANLWRLLWGGDPILYGLIICQSSRLGQSLSELSAASPLSHLWLNKRACLVSHLRAHQCMPRQNRNALATNLLGDSQKPADPSRESQQHGMHQQIHARRIHEQSSPHQITLALFWSLACRSHTSGSAAPLTVA